VFGNSKRVIVTLSPKTAGVLMQHNLIEDTQALLNAREGEVSAPTRRLALQTALGIGYAASAFP
jgi:hypothetical protein